MYNLEILPEHSTTIYGYAYVYVYMLHTQNYTFI